MSQDYQNAVVQWGEIDDPKFGHRPGFKLEVPYDISGRLDIWAIPPCEDYPEGYWLALNTGNTSSSAAEPGCNAWEKTLLCSVRLFAAPTGDEDEMDRGQKNQIEFKHPSIVATLAEGLLNPNDYSTPGEV